MCSVQAFCRTACEAEVIRSQTGTTYEWPRTIIGDIATFRCPLIENRMEIVSRRCGAFGVWEAFNEEACGVVNEQLNQLNNSFNNVSYASTCHSQITIMLNINFI